MASGEHAGGHAVLMDDVYRWQRHVYDLTRKYYLPGRDRMIAGMAVPDGGYVLELGCGTGRNLVEAARRYPKARCFGLDISEEMLISARSSIARAGLFSTVTVARADATAFDPLALFGRSGFDRVFLSYSLSMIPDWQAAISMSLACLRSGGSLHIVDFGSQDRLPRWFARLLRGWLARFHVQPRDSMREVLASEAEKIGASFSFDSPFRGYASIAVIRRRH